MVINLDKQDLIALVVGGVGPHYNIMNNPIFNDIGNFRGGFVDTWVWKISKLEKLSEDELLNIYKLCKESMI